MTDPRRAPVDILHLVDCLNLGGTERQLSQLLMTLDRRKWRTHLACFKSGGNLLSQFMEMGIHPIEFPLKGSLSQPNTLFQVTRMALACRRLGVRLVHAHDFYSNVVGFFVARLARIPVIVSRRDLGNWLSPTKKRLLKRLARSADVVLANTYAVADQTLRAGGALPEGLRIVPNGIDTKQFHRQMLRPLDSPLPPANGRRRVTTIASMNLPDKGHEDLLEAARLLKTRRHRIQWLLVSDGAIRPQIERRAKDLGLTDDVFFLGRRGDIPQILEHTDVVVHPSWAEGFPNAVLEAMCAGRPVVATRVGGCAELIDDGECGRLVAAHDPTALCKTVEELLSDFARAEALGQRAQERVEERYSLSHMCRSMESVYAELLERSASPHAA